MSHKSHKSLKHKKRRRDRQEEEEGSEEGGKTRSSLVDYSKVSDRHVGDSRYKKHAASRKPEGAPTVAASASTFAAPAPAKMSSQMEAVVRLLSGQEERTIAQKLADSNRPTWEQYKKDNSDKLNLEGVDQKKMEEYRAQLDKEREARLARGTNHGKKSSSSNKKSSKRRDHYSSEEDDISEEREEKRKARKKHKKKHKKKHRRHDDHSCESLDDDDSSSCTSDDRRRRKKKKKHHKHDKNKDESGNESDGSHYRLSKFFNQGSEE
jgi:hypothetical protein